MTVDLTTLALLAGICVAATAHARSPPRHPSAADIAAICAGKAPETREGQRLWSQVTDAQIAEAARRDALASAAARVQQTSCGLLGGALPVRVPAVDMGVLAAGFRMGRQPRPDASDACVIGWQLAFTPRTRNALLACYRKGLAEKSGLRGRIAFELTAMPDKRIDEVSVIQNAMRGSVPADAACMVEALERGRLSVVPHRADQRPGPCRARADLGFDRKRCTSGGTTSTCPDELVWPGRGGRGGVF